MPILNYTTKIDYYKTISTIQEILARNGCKKVAIDNNDNRIPVALTFVISWNNQDVAFFLPCKFDGVLKAMKKNKKIPKSFLTEEQAVRVGWRIILNWVEAQMAIVEAEAATLPEVFLPYAVTKDGGTMYQLLSKESGKSLLLLN